MPAISSCVAAPLAPASGPTSTSTTESGPNSVHASALARHDSRLRGGAADAAKPSAPGDDRVQDAGSCQLGVRTGEKVDTLELLLRTFKPSTNHRQVGYPRRPSPVLLGWRRWSGCLEIGWVDRGDRIG